VLQIHKRLLLISAVMTTISGGARILVDGGSRFFFNEYKKIKFE
jgi:hypothetical protein